MPADETRKKHCLRSGVCRSVCGGGVAAVQDGLQLVADCRKNSGNHNADIYNRIAS